MTPFYGWFSSFWKICCGQDCETGDEDEGGDGFHGITLWGVAAGVLAVGKNKINHTNFTLSHQQAIIKKRNRNFVGKDDFSMKKDGR